MESSQVQVLDSVVVATIIVSIVVMVIMKMYVTIARVVGGAYNNNGFLSKHPFSSEMITMLISLWNGVVFLIYLLF